jgi:putative copper resistance protein D
MGWAVAARAAAALMAFCGALIVPAGRAKELGLALLGAVVLLSFAWTGHGAAQEGWAGQVHLAADLLHLLAAGAWVGALVGFALLLRRPSRTPADAVRPLHDALAGFSGVGSAIVALIVVTGLANSWFLVGPRGVPALVETPYGLALTAKLLLFAGMLLLAARNRLRHTPALGAALGGMAPQTPLRALRSSIMLETALGFGVLALVGVLGLMEPITSR